MAKYLLLEGSATNYASVVFLAAVVSLQEFSEPAGTSWSDSRLCDKLLRQSSMALSHIWHLPERNPSLLLHLLHVDKSHRSFFLNKLKVPPSRRDQSRPLAVRRLQCIFKKFSFCSGQLDKHSFTFASTKSAKAEKYYRLASRGNCSPSAWFLCRFFSFPLSSVLGIHLALTEPAL